jgi:hypothetical protein
VLGFSPKRQLPFRLAFQRQTSDSSFGLCLAVGYDRIFEETIRFDWGNRDGRTLTWMIAFHSNGSGLGRHNDQFQDNDLCRCLRPSDDGSHSCRGRQGKRWQRQPLWVGQGKFRRRRDPFRTGSGVWCWIARSTYWRLSLVSAQVQVITTDRSARSLNGPVVRGSASQSATRSLEHRLTSYAVRKGKGIFG